MMVTRIEIHNWRNFKEANVALSDRAFLVGPNASGKSNFLDVFRFLRDIAKPHGGGLQTAIDMRGGISKIRCLAARMKSDVDVTVILSDGIENKDEWKYNISIAQKKISGKNFAILNKELVTKNGKIILERPEPDDKKDNILLTQTHLEQIQANSKFRVIAEFFSSILYMHLVPQLLKHPQSFKVAEIEGDPYGRSFLERIAGTPSKTQKARLMKIEKILKDAVPQLDELTFARDEITGQPHLQAKYRHWRPKGAWQREDQFSDGTLRLIALMWSFLEDDSLLLLEEPELSLHSGIVAMIPKLLHKIEQGKKKKRQVIISTHDFDLLSDRSISADEVLVLEPSSEGTTIKQAHDIKNIDKFLKSGFSLAEIVIPGTKPTQGSLFDNI